MEEVNTESLREALRVLGAGGKEVGLIQLYETLGLKGAWIRRDMREMVKQMVQRGEVRRVSAGLYRYNDAYRPRERTALARIWRFVRKEKPGWKLAEVMLKTGVSRNVVQEYCAWLEAQGHIEVMGKAGGARLFRATAQADRSPETPLPPVNVHPFEAEQKAALKIVGLMLRGDVRKPQTAREIALAARVLLTRFDRVTEYITENENENENEEEEAC